MTKPGAPEFDRYADSYTDLHRANIQVSGEEPSYFARYKAQYMAAKLGAEEANRALDVLDFGCGIGNSIPHLRDAFPHSRLLGVDPSGESIGVAADAHAGKAVFRTISGPRLPCDDDSFDLVHAACVFHHIKPGERLGWMRELRRVMKPGGGVFVFEHNVLNPLTVKAVHECPFDEDAILLPRRELLDLARAAGFSKAVARYIVFFPRVLGFMRPLEPFMGSIPFGAQYVVHAVA